MVRCPAAAVGHDMWPLWLIFDDLGGVDGRVLAGIVGGVLHNRDLLEGYCLDCYCCGVPVCVLVSLVVGCERAFMGVVFCDLLLLYHKAPGSTGCSCHRRQLRRLLRFVRWYVSRIFDDPSDTPSIDGRLDRGVGTG